MSSEYAEQIPDTEKARTVSNFLKSAPPGEFNEVFNDVRVLLDNDILLKDSISSDHSTEQFTPAKVGDTMVLVTSHGKQDGSRFLDPQSKRTFKYDHLRKEALDPQPANVDEKAEPWRAAVERAMQGYLKEHYPNGTVTVYGSSSGANIKLVACIEDHKFSPQNYCNGRWRSEWTLNFSPGGGAGDLKGLLRVQVHYYEDGNVQLVSSKELQETCKTGSEDATAKEFLKVVETAENEYQTALGDNYKTMSQTTFKALRRALPVTRTKVDWNKIAAYNIGSELKGK